MSELPSELRSLLAEGRRAHEPEPMRLEAVRARLIEGAAPAPEFDLAPPSPRVRRWWLLPALCVLAIVVGMVLWPSASIPSTAQQVAPRVAPGAEPQRKAEVAPAVTPAMEPGRALDGDTAATVPAPRVERARATHARAAQDAKSSASARGASSRVSPAAVLPVAAEAPVEPVELAATPARESSTDAVSQRVREPTSGASLQDEVKWIARAQKALADGDLAAAERALSTHELTYPAGQLQAERIALLARARCLAEDFGAARRLHAQLALLVPGSSLLRSVERACPNLTR
ncbi:MAG: hypothetical protein JWN04_5646 [Myxococcaceae bacterium]|nr:hypothetical protein [Myxococcaceae bacterium]